MTRSIRAALASIVAASAFSANAGISLLAGSPNAQVVRGQVVDLGIRLLVTDSAGQPVAGAKINYFNAEGFSFEGCGPERSGTCYMYTGTDGTAAAPRINPFKVGTWPVDFTTDVGADHSYVFGHLTVLPAGPPLTLTAVSGAGQSAVAGQHYVQPISILVTRDGQPVANRAVGFQISRGHGAMVAFDGTFSTSCLGTTDASGLAQSATFAAGSGLGPGWVTVTAADEIEGNVVELDVPFTVTDASGAKAVPLPRMWWGGAANAGWGISVAQHNWRTFPVLFTYKAGKPWWEILPSQWETGFGTRLYGYGATYTGSPFYRFDPSSVKGTVDVSNISLVVPAAGNGQFQVFSAMISPAPPEAAANIEPFRFSPALPQPERGVSDMWWGGPAQSGWGISIVEDQGNLFLAWFTYGEDGQPTWFVMPDGSWADGDTWKGPIYRTTGTSVYTSDAVKAPYSATKVGDFTIRFSGTTAATFTYTVDGHAGTLNLQRFDF